MPYQSTWNNPYLANNSYQPAMNMPQQQIPAQQAPLATGWPQSNGWNQQQPFNGRVLVNGQESALQIQLPPNSTSIPLIDSSFDGDKGILYFVHTDGTGSKSVESFDLKRHVDKPVTAVQSDVVSRDEFNAALEQIRILKEEIVGLRAAIPPAV